MLQCGITFFNIFSCRSNQCFKYSCMLNTTAYTERFSWTFFSVLNCICLVSFLWQIHIIEGSEVTNGNNCFAKILLKSLQHAHGCRHSDFMQLYTKFPFVKKYWFKYINCVPYLTIMYSQISPYLVDNLPIYLQTSIHCCVNL